VISLSVNQQDEVGSTDFTLPYLKAWRNRRILTMRELSQLADVAEATIVNLEKGGVARQSTIKKLAKALNIAPEQLLNEDPNTSPK
jgi:transcriptional regulator with XRE-family HTH domain